jgi:hypothetical protein
MKVWLAAAVVLAVVAGGTFVARQTGRRAQVRGSHLEGSIPAANREKYKSISDVQSWLNPKLVIRAESVDVISSSGTSAGKTVRPADLRTMLIDLPVGAWPYGRVVQASVIGVRAGDRTDAEAIQRNRQMVEEVLGTLQIEVEWWPSA